MLMTMADREVFRELLAGHQTRLMAEIRDEISRANAAMLAMIQEMLAAREYTYRPMLPLPDYQSTLPPLFGRTTTTTNEVHLEE